MVMKALKYGFIIIACMTIIGAFVPKKENNSNNQQEQTQTAESSTTSNKDSKTTDSGNKSTSDSQPAEKAETVQTNSVSNSNTSEETYVKVDGMHAIQEYGDSEFPYGWNLHDVMGVISIQPQSDGSWFIKCECDVKNAYGTKINGICEATIVGSGENWTVTSFNVYEV